MPRDIVERLRDRAYSGLPDPLLAEAADEIERLRNGAVSSCETVRPETNLDAAPAAKAPADRYVRRAAADAERDRTDTAAARPGDPVAWAVTDRKALAWIGVFDGEPDPEFVWHDEAKARRWINTRPGVELAPLAIAPTLTDAEREAVERGYCSLMGVEDMSEECTRWDAEAAATLRGLLDRLA